ncbi:MAG: superoxide dismutase [Erysipelotrichaceae bacterium]|nr:superoxide dismutase [Erysipelotrichaceae bacterium]
MNNKYPYKVKSLPYQIVSLEPIIDKTTLSIHHDKIYLNYVEKLNLLIKENKCLENYTLEELIYNPYLIPPTIINKVLYYAGGIYNHELYFDNLSPTKNTQINGLFKDKILEEYKTIENYQETLFNIATSPINYHWIITTINNKNKIETIGLKDNDTSIPLNLYPLLVIDITEHAYFIKYHNHKDHYLKNILTIINYDVINERLKKI